MHFDKEEKPFVAFIISPYNSQIDVYDTRSKINCFHVNNEMSNKTFQLKTNIVPQRRVSKLTLELIMEQIEKSKNAKDGLNLEKEWKGDLTKKEKLL